MNQFEDIPKSEYLTINVTLPESLNQVLHNLGVQARRSGGHKLPKTLIIRALIRMMMELDVDVTGVRTEKELLDRLMEAVRAYKG